MPKPSKKPRSARWSSSPALNARHYPDLRDNGLPPSRKLQKSLNEDAHNKLPELIAPAKVADEQLSSALQQLDQMTVGKSDPHYGAALEAVRKASAAVGGTDPVSGQPYARAMPACRPN